PASPSAASVARTSRPVSSSQSGADSDAPGAIQTRGTAGAPSRSSVAAAWIAESASRRTRIGPPRGAAGTLATTTTVSALWSRRPGLGRLEERLKLLPLRGPERQKREPGLAAEVSRQIHRGLQSRHAELGRHGRRRRAQRRLEPGRSLPVPRSETLEQLHHEP